MNKENEKANNDDLLKELVGRYVAVKFNNGRVISGSLLNRENRYEIKVGVIYIPFTPDKIQRIRVV